MPSSLRWKIPATFILIVLVVIVARGFLTPNLPDSIYIDRSASAKGKVWTIIGNPDSSYEAFVDMAGAFQPGAQRYSIHYFIYDHDKRTLYSPEVNNPRNASQSLLDGYLPSPRVKWQKNGIAVEVVSFSGTSSDVPVCFSSVLVRNSTSKPKNISVFLAAVPVGIPGGACSPQSIQMVQYDKKMRSVLTDNSVLLSCDSKPDVFGVVTCDNESTRRSIDVTSYIQKGILSSSKSAVASLSRNTSCAVRYDMRLEPGKKRMITFKSPMNYLTADDWARKKESRITYSQALEQLRSQWSSQLKRVEIKVPDKRYSDCFYANLAYLLILTDDGLPKPGATIYHTFWTRDFAYISDALYYAGRADATRFAIEHLKDLKLPNGGFAPTLGSNKDAEYDAPGQIIYVLLQDYRRTGDKVRLMQKWPLIRAACLDIKAKRLANKWTDPAKRGILPPSMSAEDLGKADQQHYWDDFWAVRGLQDAVYAANLLKMSKDAKWIRDESESLNKALWSSIRAVAGASKINYIPNGPEEVISSGMARGTSCALWPCMVLDVNDPFVQSSFDTYWKKWIEPHNGGTEHKGEYWPYEGMDLAQGYLMLNQPERAQKILRWTLSHISTGDFYAWCEGMNMKDLSVSMGDIPHGWMCASYISLMRNLLVRESGKDLLLASGVLPEWLAPGKEIAIRDFPTLFGKMSYSLKAKQNALHLSITGTARPAGSYKIILPKSILTTGITADGKNISLSGNTVIIPASAKEVEIGIRRL